MPKRYINVSEQYPVFSLDEQCGRWKDSCYEFTQEEIDRVAKAKAEYIECQKFLQHKFKEEEPCPTPNS